MNPAKRLEIFTRFRAARPHPKTELEYRTPFELLVAVILSAQATDVSVNAATRILFPVANTPQALLDLGEEKLREYVQRIGLYQTKSRHIMQACKLLVEQHGGEVPQTREMLEALPGVGRKTANVILNTAFGQPTIAVDTHVFRVANRTGIAPGKDVLEVENKLLKVVPDEFRHDAHHWLILHGRYVCQARKPKCAAVPDNGSVRIPGQNDLMFNPTRDEARNFLFESWRKRREGGLLTPLEDLAAQLIEKHPEYHSLLADPERYQDKDYAPEQGATNPFLHLMMHLTIEEQISIDQPAGIRAHFARLTRQFESEHDAQHRMMECLGEMIWQAQRNRTQPDAAIYLACLEKQ